jgi:hypothetical protein
VLGGERNPKEIEFVNKALEHKLFAVCRVGVHHQHHVAAGHPQLVGQVPQHMAQVAPDYEGIGALVVDHHGQRPKPAGAHQHRPSACIVVLLKLICLPNIAPALLNVTLTCNWRLIKKYYLLI